MSSFFVSRWGMLQWFCYRAGFTYPAFICNTSLVESATGYTETLDDLGHNAGFLRGHRALECLPSLACMSSGHSAIFARPASGRVVISENSGIARC